MRSRRNLARLLLLLALFGPAPVAAEEREAVLAAVSAVGPPSEDAGVAARAVVESLHGVLLDCMKQAGEFGFQGRYERIAAELDEAFDLTFMARVAVGSAWKELAEQERSEFVDLSRSYSASKYAYNFDGYGGERFETHLHEPAARGTMLVKTTLVQPKDDDVRFDYRLRHTGGRWRIIDIQLNGQISELTVRRAQYRSLIRREGFPQLVESLEEKIDELSRE
jgi:phospholipid transport system substrate-binding protein